jgi:hypothetical protein
VAALAAYLLIGPGAQTLIFLCQAVLIAGWWRVRIIAILFVLVNG